MAAGAEAAAGGRRSFRLSLETASEQHHGDCARHDAQVFSNSAPLEVFEVVAHLFTNVIDARVVRLIYLGPASDAGLRALPQRILLDVVAES